MATPKKTPFGEIKKVEKHDSAFDTDLVDASVVDDAENADIDFHKILEKKLSRNEFNIVVRVGGDIGKVGMSYEEACLHQRVNKSFVDKIIERVPEVDSFLRMKSIDYKHGILDVINAQAKENRDTRTAMWLMERLFSNEYGSGKKKDDSGEEKSEDNTIAMAVAFVRENNSGVRFNDDQKPQIHEHEE